MNWVLKIQEAINYIENNLLEEVNIEMVGKAINYSPSSFQQLFSAITGYSISEYIRLRRLSCAANELLENKCSVTETAFKYGYDTVESFSKAYKRLHGYSPSKTSLYIKKFDPIKIDFRLNGGFDMSSNFIPTLITGLRPIDWSDVKKQSEYVWSVISALEKLGESINYDYVVCVSASAFRASITSAILNPGDYHVSRNPEIINHTFKMLGYDTTLFDRSDFETDKKRIMDSIDKGLPVLTIEGVVNCADCCVIGGYDDGGNVLLGYNPFMDQKDDHDEPHDNSGYFRKTNWHNGFFEEAGGKYIIINHKIPKLSKREIYLETLALACKIINGTQKDDQLNGYSAHTRYAEMLVEEHEDLFGLYLTILCLLKLYIDKIYIADFLRKAKLELTEYDSQLENAAKCYDEVIVCRGKLSTIITEDFSFMDRISEIEPRVEYAKVILQIRDLESKAASYLSEIGS